MEVFIRGDSEISIQAADYATKLADRTRGLDVVIHDVMKDREQLSRLWNWLSKRAAKSLSSPHSIVAIDSTSDSQASRKRRQRSKTCSP